MKIIILSLTLLIVGCSNSNSSRSITAINTNDYLVPERRAPVYISMDSTLRSIEFYKSVNDSLVPLSKFLENIKDTSKNYPKVVTYRTPRYPELAHRAGLDGNVILKMTVNSYGRVQVASIFHSDGPIFEASAIDSIDKWTFSPLIIQSVPQEYIALVPLFYRIIK